MTACMAPMTRAPRLPRALGPARGGRLALLAVPAPAETAEGIHRPCRGANHVLRHFSIASPLRARLAEGGPDEEPPPTDPTRQALRELLCVGQDVDSSPTRRPFTPQESQRMNAVRWAARSTTSRAYQALGRGDRYLDTVATRVFHTNIDAGRASSRVASIRQKLDSVPIEVAGCGDAPCRDPEVAARVTDDLSTMVLCPRIFATSAGQMRRTLIHEAGHAAGIDSSVTGDENYCTPRVDCHDPCDNLRGDQSKNVDAWAHFIECAASS